MSASPAPTPAPAPTKSPNKLPFPAQLYDYCGPQTKTPDVGVTGVDATNPIPPQPLDGFTLAHAQVFIRHGDRVMAGSGPCWPDDQGVFDCQLQRMMTPVRRAADASSSSRFYRQVYEPGFQDYAGDCAVGSLTDKGHAQQRRHGEQLRSRYVVEQGLLPSRLDRNAMHVHSTSIARTLASVQSLLEGMYSEVKRCDEGIVDISTTDIDDTVLLEARHLCPARAAALSAAKKTKKWAALTKERDAIGDALRVAMQLNGTATLKAAPYVAADGWPLTVADCAQVHLCQRQPLHAGLDAALLKRLLKWRIDTCR
jgi:hypothetical protein